MKLHPKITFEKVENAINRSNTTCDNPGFCLACGEENEGIEPDGEGGECEACGAMKVMGAEQIILCFSFV